MAVSLPQGPPNRTRDNLASWVVAISHPLQLSTPQCLSHAVSLSFHGVADTFPMAYSARFVLLSLTFYLSYRQEAEDQASGGSGAQEEKC